MLELKYSLVIEATDDPNFFGFYSHDLEGFTGIGHSIEDCIYKARWGMEEHVALLRNQKLPVPEPNSDPMVVVHNERRSEPAGRASRRSTPSRKGSLQRGAVRRLKNHLDKK
jgi:predicted RNase H-like HicB family nuclease